MFCAIIYLHNIYPSNVQQFVLDYKLSVKNAIINLKINLFGIIRKLKQL